MVAFSMKRFTFPILGVLVFLFLLAACSREEAAPVNPRLAKSGQKLTDEREIPVANDSSDSVSPENKEPVIATSGSAQSAAAASAPEAPTLNKAQMSQLIAQASSGNANAQVELGNAFFEGKGVPLNKKAAKYWWRQAAAQRHPVAVQNLKMLNTKPEEGVSFFGTPSKGDRFVFIIDKSGSMKRGNRFPKAKVELIRVLRALPQNARFMIYFFDGGAEAMPANAMLAAVPKNIQFAEKWINGRTFGSGGTNPSQALRFTFSLKPDTVWLLTDGKFFNDETVVARIRQANPQKKIRINTLAIMDRQGEPVLKQIASENDGTYRFVGR
jgi:hypothetical protein